MAQGGGGGGGVRFLNFLSVFALLYHVHQDFIPKIMPEASVDRYSQIERQGNALFDRQIDRYIDTYRQIDKAIYIKFDRQIDIEIVRHTDRRTDRQTF